MTISLYARDVLDLGISKNVFVILVCFFSLIIKYENLVSLILFTLPLLCGLPGNYFLPLWCLLIMCHQVKRKSLDLFAVCFWGTIVIWELAIYTFYSYEIPPMIVISYFMAFFIVCTLISEKTHYNYKYPVIFFCIGCCVLLGIIYLMYSSDPTMLASDGDIRMGGDLYVDTKEMTLKTNANNIGYLSVSAIASMFALFYYKKVELKVFLPIVVIAFFCGMYSVSRTWAISLVLILILYFVLQKENRLMGYLLLIALLLIGFYYFSQNPIMLNAFILRFTSDDMETGGGRSDLFAQYNEFLTNHPWNLLFGTSAQLYKEVTGLYHSTHNSLQQIWLSYGIIGFFFIMIVYIRTFMKYYTKKQYMAYMPMFVMVFFLQTIQVLNPYNGLFPLIAAFYIMKMVKKNDIK